MIEITAERYSKNIFYSGFVFMTIPHIVSSPDLTTWIWIVVFSTLFTDFVHIPDVKNLDDKMCLGLTLTRMPAVNGLMVGCVF